MNMILASGCLSINEQDFVNSQEGKVKQQTMQNDKYQSNGKTYDQKKKKTLIKKQTIQLLLSAANHTVLHICAVPQTPSALRKAQIVKQQSFQGIFP